MLAIDSFFYEKMSLYTLWNWILPSRRLSALHNKSAVDGNHSIWHFQMSKSSSRATLSQYVYWNELDKGAQFGALETPDAMVREIRSALVRIKD
jgi:hypothetical protein